MLEGRQLEAPGSPSVPGEFLLLGVRLFEARVAAGLTQEELASRVGVSRQSVRNWEKGQTSPRAHYSKLEAALGRRDQDGELSVAGATTQQVLSTIGAMLPAKGELSEFVPGELRALRESAGFTRAAVCRASGVSKESVRNWERGVTAPRPVMLQRVLAVVAPQHPSVMRLADAGLDELVAELLRRADSESTPTKAVRE